MISSQSTTTSRRLSPALIDNDRTTHTHPRLNNSISELTSPSDRRILYLPILQHTNLWITVDPYNQHPIHPPCSACNPHDQNSRDHTITMDGNIVIFLIVIILFIVLAIIGFLIYWAQTGFSRGRGGSASETSGDDV